MFRLTVRDHMMVAHSLPDPFFGPAAALHGATFEVEATLERSELDEHGVVADIGAASTRLSEILGHLTYRNLDEMEEFAGVLTTTERLAQYVADRLAESEDLGGVEAIEVTLRENPDAWASYRRDV